MSLTSANGEPDWWYRMLEAKHGVSALVHCTRLCCTPSTTLGCAGCATCNPGLTSPGVGNIFSKPAAQPYRCPVCNGSGIVHASLYGGVELGTASTETCRSCSGSGVLWR